MTRAAALSVLVALWLASGLADSVQAAVSVMEQTQQRGPAAPTLALPSLRTVVAPGPTATLALRRNYHAAVAMQAIAAGDAAAEAAAVTALETMAKVESCQPCQTQALVRRAWRAEALADGAQLRDLLATIDALPASAEPWLQLERLMVGAAGNRALGRFDEALARASASVALAAELQQPEDQTAALMVLARIYLDRHQPLRAWTVSEQAFRQAEQTGSVDMQTRLRRLQAQVLVPLAQPDRQRTALDDALRLARSAPNLETLQLLTLLDLARYQQRRGLYLDAADFAAQAGALAQRLDRPDLHAAALIEHAGALIRAGRSQQGLPSLAQAVAMSEQQTNTPDALVLLAEAADLYEHAGRAQDVITVLRKQQRLRRQLNGQQSEQALIEAQDRLSAERRANQAERKQLVKTRQRAEVDHQSLLAWLWALSCAVLMLAVLLVWRSRQGRFEHALPTDLPGSRPPIDLLTGVYHRRHCDWLMSHPITPRATRSRDRHVQPYVSLMLVDIDHFRRINDCHGHAAGDGALVAIAQRLQALLREQDAVARWGDDEFLLILPGTGPESLSTVASRVLAVIGDDPIELDLTRVLITVSAGAIAWPAFPGQHWLEAIDMAEQALLLAKSNGRNRANCLVALAPGADLDRTRRDVARAHHAGDIDMVSVDGPNGWMIAAAVALQRADT